jgi:DNA-directed RNA polymerase sigma subunit (sigma70/sigma32)
MPINKAQRERLSKWNVTPELAEDIRDSYLAGETLAQVASKYGYSAGKISRILECLRIRRRRKGPQMSDEMKQRYEQAIRLYREGKSLRAVGLAVHLTGERVRQILVARKIERGRQGKRRLG